MSEDQKPITIHHSGSARERALCVSVTPTQTVLCGRYGYGVRPGGHRGLSGKYSRVEAVDHWSVCTHDVRPTPPKPSYFPPFYPY